MIEKETGLPQHDDEKNWARLIYIAKKHLDIWTHQNITPYKGNLKLSYMPLIFNINFKGSTNTELSKKALIAKQAMSRTIKELEEKEMIVTRPIINDKRSYSINLTDDGKTFVFEAQKKMVNLIENYKNLVGDKDFNTTVDVLSKIIRYHEKLNKDSKEINSSI